MCGHGGYSTGTAAPSFFFLPGSHGATAFVAARDPAPFGGAPCRSGREHPPYENGWRKSRTGVVAAVGLLRDRKIRRSYRGNGRHCSDATMTVAERHSHVGKALAHSRSAQRQTYSSYGQLFPQGSDLTPSYGEGSGESETPGGVRIERAHGDPCGRRGLKEVGCALRPKLIARLAGSAGLGWLC